MKKVFLLVLTGLVLAACIREDVQEQVEIRFAICQTRSSVLAGDTEVNHLCVMAYRDGRLETSANSSVSSGLSVRLASGRTYNLYALANVPSFTPPAEETELLAYSLGFSSVRELDSGLPASWRRTALVFNAPQTVLLDLERLVCALELSLDRSALEGTRVTSVKLKNCASSITPFASESRAKTISGVQDGDFASESDLVQLNAGGVLRLYALENCQGQLLPSNADPWKKVPPASLAGLCTRLDLGLVFQDGSPLQGSATYRIYPGRDATGDFNLVRNENLQLAFSLTDLGLDYAIGIVEKQADYREGLVSYSLVSGLHDVDDFYVGETLLFRLDLSEELQNYWSEGRCTQSRVILAAESSDGIEELEDYLYFSDIIEDDGAYYFYADAAHVLDTHRPCALYLVDDADNLVCKMLSQTALDSYVNLRGAEIALAPLDESGYCVGVPELNPDALQLIINGDQKSYGVFLADESGHIFTSNDGSGFDFSRYSGLCLSSIPGYGLHSVCSQVQEARVANCLKSTLKYVGKDYPLPYYKLDLSLENRGTDELVNEALSLGLMRPDAFTLLFDNNPSEGSVLSVTYDALPWKAWLLGPFSESGFYNSSYIGDNTQLALYNPSHISLDLFLDFLACPNMALLPCSNGRIQRFVSSSMECREAIFSNLDRRVEAYDAPSVGFNGNNVYQAVIDGIPVDVYRIQYGYGYYADLNTLYYQYRQMFFENSAYEHALDGDKHGMLTEIRLQSLSGRVPDGSEVNDMIPSASNPDFSKYHYRGMNYWDEDGSLHVGGINPLGEHQIEDLRRLIAGDGTLIEFSWDNQSNLYCRIDDEAHRAFSINGYPTYYVYLRYTPDNGKTFYYQSNDHSFSTSPTLYAISSETDSRIKSKIVSNLTSGAAFKIASLLPMEKEMGIINRSYWMASCTQKSYYDSDTYGRSHRWSTMAVPQAIEVRLSISCDDPSWIPVELSLGVSEAVLGSYTFIEKTKVGGFAEYVTQSTTNRAYARNNPDGSPQTDGAWEMPASDHVVIPEITSDAIATDVTPMTECKVQLRTADTGVSKLAIF